MAPILLVFVSSFVLDIVTIDEQTEERRTALVRQIDGGQRLSDMQIAALGRDKDYLLRSVAALLTPKFHDLLPLASDKSELVRSFVALRIVDFEKDEKQKVHFLLDILLLDPSELVRSSALISARQAKYCPASILRGLIADVGRYEHFVGILDSEDADAAGLRKRFGLTDLTEPTLRLFRGQILLGIVRQRQSPLFERILPPLDRSGTIAWAAADYLMTMNEKEAKEFFRVAIPIVKDQVLAARLQEIVRE